MYDYEYEEYMYYSRGYRLALQYSTIGAVPLFTADHQD